MHGRARAAGGGLTGLLGGAVLLVLAGCTAGTTAPSTPPAVSRSPSSSPTAIAVPSIPVPRGLPGEVARAVASPALVDATSGDFPKGARRFYVHLRCTGPAGSTMHYAVLHADGHPFGPSGDWTCDRTPGVVGDQSARPLTGGAQLRITADPGVTTAWAVLSTSAEG